MHLCTMPAWPVWTWFAEVTALSDVGEEMIANPLSLDVLMLLISRIVMTNDKLMTV